MSSAYQLELPTASSPVVERRFLGWSEPFLPKVAEALAARYLSPGELRMDAALVVVPGGRAGRRLKELLLARAEASGVRLVPPRIVTVGHLPEMLYTPELPAASDALTRRAWVMALRGLYRSRLRVLVPDPPRPDDLVGWTRLAATIEALHREVAGGGATFAAVPGHCEEGLLFSDADRWRVLAEVQASYARVLRGLGASDVGLERIAAAGREVELPDADLWVAGVVEMPGVVAELLTRLAERVEVRVLVHAPEREADAFDALGRVVPSMWTRRPVPIPDALLSVADRPADQADEVVRALASLDGRYAAEEIAIAVPDDEVAPYLEQRLSAAGVPARRATGGRVVRTAAPRLLAAIADYLDGRRYEACAALARHPDLWRWIRRRRPEPGAEASDSWVLGTPGAWVSLLDEHFNRRLPLHLPAGRIEGDGRSAAAVRRLVRALDDDRMLGRLRGTRRIAEWMPELMALLLEVYGESPLDRAVPDQRALLDALSTLKDLASELHRLPEEADERCDAPTAIRLLLHAAETRTLTPRADDAAVELLGWLEVHLDDAPVTIVTGLNEGVLPESVNADAYLPDSLRSRLGLTDNATRYARDAYQTTAMLASRERLHLIGGRRTVRGDPLRPSRLMFAVEGPALADRVQRFYGEAGDGAGSPAPAGAARPSAEAGAPGFPLPPEPELCTTAPIESLSVSRFGDVLQDPYLFALTRLRRLEPLDDAATELDGLAFGNLAHRVLERFGADPRLSTSTDARAIERALDAILDEVVHDAYGRDALPAVRLQAEQLRVRLHGFARWQADRAADGWRIVGVECTTPEAGAPFPVDGEPFAITGRIDRIDYHPERDEWAIFDYKSGDAGDTPDATHRKGRGAGRVWTSLQLPLYRRILPHVMDAAGARPFTGPDPDVVSLGYILLPRDAEAAGASYAEWSAAELEEAEEAARDVVRLLRGGRFRWNPAARPPRDERLAAVLGFGYLETAAEAGDGEDDDV